LQWLAAWMDPEVGKRRGTIKLDGISGQEKSYLNFWASVHGQLSINN